jgi:hypothetical protein
MAHDVLIPVRTSKYPFDVIDGLLLKICGDLAIVFANIPLRLIHHYRVGPLHSGQVGT